MATTTLPSIKQMVQRSHDGHKKALRAIAASQPLVRPGAFPSEVRGMRVVADTLLRWGCIESERVGVGEYVTSLTDRGRELLAAYGS